MDPYLESPDWFPCLHHCLIVLIIGSLNSRLPESSYAKSNHRVWPEYTLRPIGPGVVPEAVELTQPVVIPVEMIEHDPFEEPFVEIHRRDGSDDRLVATIEVVSPANKTPGNPGRETYLAKQREILAGQPHLIEIDLLRGGTHVTAVPRDLALERAGPFDYHVCVRRFDRPNAFFVYPIRLEQRLPGIAIPLLRGDPDVPLPLQSVLDRAYDEGPYGRVVRYGEAPLLPPLRPEQLEWVQIRLQPPA
jgi:hypothetical protein